MKLIIIITLLCVYPFNHGNYSSAQSTSNDIVMQPSDKKIAEQILTKFRNDYQLKTNLLLIKVGKFLLETPYAANTLEIVENEQMVINLRALDCTTFAENCLALARTIQKKETSFVDFVNELKFIRYRDGILNEYPSRLHYFSDWIFNNEKKILIKDMSKEIGQTPFPTKVNFMSNHPENYPALINKPDFIKQICQQESEISNRANFYIPKNKFAKYEHLLQDGDIIGITTNIDGMDIMHVGFAIHKRGRIHILHASQLHKKVLVSNDTLEKYLKTKNSATGIMVARPL